MEATIEISLYPLLQKNAQENYKHIVLEFLETIKKNKSISIETNGLSSIIYGNYDDIIKLFSNEIKFFIKKHTSIFVFKLAKGKLKYN